MQVDGQQQTAYSPEPGISKVSNLNSKQQPVQQHSRNHRQHIPGHVNVQIWSHITEQLESYQCAHS